MTVPPGIDPLVRAGRRARQRKASLWTCQRVTEGIRCGFKNPARRRKCLMCGKLRPPKRRAKHLDALEVGYAIWVGRFGERCGICDRLPSASRRLDRDHDHKTGKPRGLLCARCNRALPAWVTVEWLERAARYVGRQP